MDATKSKSKKSNTDDKTKLEEQASKVKIGPKCLKYAMSVDFIEIVIIFI